MAQDRLKALKAENEELRLRLDEAESALEAIRRGELESLMEEGRVGRVMGRVVTMVDASEHRRAEERLRETQLRTAAILEGIADTFYSLDRQWRFTVVNTAAERAPFARPASELLGKVIWDLYPALVGTRIHQHYLDAAEKLALEHYVARSPLNGQWYEVFVQGWTGGVDVYMRDVTERKLAEEALQESEARFRSVLEESRDVIYRFSLQTGRYEYISPSVETIVGYSSDEMKALDIEASFAMIHPDDAPAVRAQIARLEATGKEELEYRQRTRSGDYRWLSNHMALVKDGSGRPLYRSGNIRDVTERKRLEARSVAVARLYEVLSRANESIVRSRDEQSLYERICEIMVEVGGFPLAWIGLAQEREVRPVAYRGCAVDYLRYVKVEVVGVLGQGPTGTCIRENRAVVNDDFLSNSMTLPWREAAVRFGFRASAAFPLRRQDRVVGALSLYASDPAAFDAEHVKLIESLCADVSYAIDAMEQERRRAEAERALRESEQNLRDADRHKNEFMAVLSHELRNPLAPIKNSLYVLERATPGSDQARRAFAVIDRQVTQLTRLVDDLLDITRIDSNKIHLQRQRLELNKLVRRTVEDHRFLFEKGEVKFELALAPEPIFVNADFNRLAQVIGNLLQNAAKFTPPAGHIAVSLTTEPKSRQAVLRIADNGIGMAPGAVERLFQPFMQAEKAIDRSRGGLGLGLALVKGLVEMHGGTVSGTSDGLGKGSVFTVRLPLDAKAIETISAGAPDKRVKSRRVLIVEDNVDAANSLREAIEFGEHVAEVAYNGVEALKKARVFKPEVVICDIGLPGVDGYEVARAFRADHELRNVQLVALTGYAQSEDIAKASEAGFDRHVSKPPSLEDLDKLLGSGA